MLKIRLARVGKRNTPIFRLVVAEKSRAVKRKNLEILGVYNPTVSGDKFQVNKERVNFWMSKGAQPSLTVHNLLCNFGVLPKNKRIKITFSKPQKKKDKIAEKRGTAAEKSAEKEKTLEVPEKAKEESKEEQKEVSESEVKEKPIESEKSHEKNQPKEELTKESEKK